MGVRLTFSGGVEFEDQLAALNVKALKGSEIGTREGALLIVEAIKEQMDGPDPPKPGGSDPARQTGNLIGAVEMRAVGGSVGAGRWNYEISMNQGRAPYARRIELGFTGTDSLGRNYNQPPYPYFYKGIDLALATGIVDDIFFKSFEEAMR